MTGYGKSSYQTQEGIKITTEIRALNSKQLDLSIRLPGFLREKENEIRGMCNELLERGKIDFSIVVENSGTTRQYGINKAVLKNYLSEIVEFSDEMGISAGNEIISSLIRLPDVITDYSTELSTLVWEGVLASIKNAIDQCRLFREQEGFILEKDICTRIDIIKRLSSNTDLFEEARMNRIKGRLLEEISKIEENTKYDRNRFEQELIYYIEKIDITEEKVRLSNHIDYFNETIESSVNNGKKLGFITQEIGREINTMGSKANDVEIQKLVIQMKDELEKIREQLMNIL